jgi:hypothetical protein
MQPRAGRTSALFAILKIALTKRLFTVDINRYTLPFRADYTTFQKLMKLL